MAPPLCPPFFLLRGYPNNAQFVLGRPPHTAGAHCRVKKTPGGFPPGVLVCRGFVVPLLLSRGVPQGAHFVWEWGALDCAGGDKFL